MSVEEEQNDSNLTEVEPDQESLGAIDPDMPPMTFSLIGRFFAVPLIIIGTIVGGAVMVVLLFGGPASPEQRSIDQLLQALEATSGERSMGVLLTRDKELWQAALELSLRLENKAKEPDLTAEKLTELAGRLGTMVISGLEDVDRLPTVGKQREQQYIVRSRRVTFLIHALGWTQRPEAVDPLVIVLKQGEDALSVAAMQALGRLHELPNSSKSVSAIVDSLNQSGSAEVQLVASTVLSILGEPGDGRVIDALKRARLSQSGEVEWAASLSLARLGNPAGKATLMDLLDRSFLERDDLYHTRDKDGTVHRYPLPPNRVDELLMVTIDAVTNLDDEELWSMIQTLTTDESPPVRDRAKTVVKTRLKIRKNTHAVKLNGNEG